ncbi:MAG: hypothetical protein J3Q66DRAFT_353961 [Benniella sp.]|nr:MAG: hypothetical protein J3Q66DRAFT_353961 [Benniella sp.]
MLFAKTLIVLCFATVAMAESRRCKCSKATMQQDYDWTEAECNNLNGEMQWCYDTFQTFCDAGNRSTEFNEKCESDTDCYVATCD